MIHSWLISSWPQDGGMVRHLHATAWVDQYKGKSITCQMSASVSETAAAIATSFSCCSFVIAKVCGCCIMWHCTPWGDHFGWPCVVHCGWMWHRASWGEHMWGEDGLVWWVWTTGALWSEIWASWSGTGLLPMTLCLAAVLQTLSASNCVISCAASTTRLMYLLGRTSTTLQATAPHWNQRFFCSVIWSHHHAWRAASLDICWGLIRAL